MAHVYRLIAAVLLWSVSLYAAAVIQPVVRYKYYSFEGTASEIVAQAQANQPTISCGGGVTKALNWYSKNPTSSGVEIWHSRDACPGYGPYDGFQFSAGAIGTGCPANSSLSGGSCACNTGFTEINGACEARNENRDRCASFAVSQTLPGGALVQDYRLQGNVSDGAQFCMPGAFDSASKGCKVSFSRDTFLDYGGAASVTEGTFSMAGDSSTVDQSCDVGPNNSPPKVPEKEKCPNGYTGTVNGVEVCINKVPNSGADGGSDETETNDGTETTTRRIDRSTNCEGDKCTTTTTTTTTRRNNSTGATTTTTTTSTSTTSKPGFCQENPSSKLCKDGKDDGSAFGGSCGAGFTCEGDAIQCAMAQEQHRRACKLFDDQTPESQLYDAEKSKTGKRTADLPGNETIAFGQSMYDSSNALGPGTCISDLPVDVLGQTVSLPISQICPHLATLRLALLAFGALMWVLIVFRG
ncbi:hypothetical protein ACTJKQ_24405 [Acidovorax sp. 22279]|uniref:hypothetical protein n=1 Tax=Acidovorax sp. 22279 TaxID=3453900 RepID=UPI003F84B708